MRFKYSQTRIFVKFFLGNREIALVYSAERSIIHKLMHQDLPDTITLSEVGPRDGFQAETQIIPIDLKIRVITGLAAAGLKKIQVTSFVDPRRVPQMADAEALVGRLPRIPDVEFYGLVLNMAGVERAGKAGLESVEISISASDAHGRKNAGMSVRQAMDRSLKMIRRARGLGMRIRAGIQCAFGCVYEGPIEPARVLEIARGYVASGIDMLCVADTTGMADPLKIRGLVKQLTPVAGKIPIALHLHDTRGLGLVNVLAGMDCGITHFDTALAGMGGCPFVSGAAGNIATEDTAHLLETMAINTGIDIPGVARCSIELGTFLNKGFAGHVYRLYS